MNPYLFRLFLLLVTAAAWPLPVEAGPVASFLHMVGWDTPRVPLEAPDIEDLKADLEQDFIREVLAYRTFTTDSAAERRAMLPDSLGISPSTTAFELLFSTDFWWFPNNAYGFLFYAEDRDFTLRWHIRRGDGLPRPDISEKTIAMVQDPYHIARIKTLQSYVAGTYNYMQFCGNAFVK